MKAENPKIKKSNINNPKIKKSNINNSNIKKSNINNLKEFIIVAVFILMIVSLPLLSLIFKSHEYSTYEKRMLSEFPTIKAESVIKGEFGTKMEDYISDHFIFRTFFLGVNGYSNLLIGKNGVNDIYLAEDGYLIEKPQEDFEKQIEKKFSLIKDFAQKNSLQLQVMFVPTTGFILKEKLPFIISKEYKDDKVLDNINTSFSKEIIPIDIREEFTINKKEELYYKTDHHWTSFGAYIAYKKYCDINNITPTQRDNFTIQKHKGFYGTTYARSCLWLMKPDEINLWKDIDYNELEIEMDKVVSDNKDLFFEDNLKGDEPYTVFLDGNHGFVKIKNNKVTDGVLLIIRDSFADSFVPFLTKHYNTIYLIDLRYYKNPISELIKEEKFDKILLLYGLNNFAKDNNLVWLK